MRRPLLFEMNVVDDQQIKWCNSAAYIMYLTGQNIFQLLQPLLVQCRIRAILLVGLNDLTKLALLVTYID